MLKIFRKCLYSLLTLLGVVTVVFVLFNVLPGDPARMMLGQNQNAGQVAAVKKKFGFDQPLIKQYLYYLNDLSPVSWHSNESNDYTSLDSSKYNFKSVLSTTKSTMVIKWPYLRESFTKQGKKVSKVILETLPNTFVLAIAAILIAIVLGMILGVVSALNKDSFIDKFIQVASTIGMSVPSFFSAIIFAWLFGFVWHEYTNLEMTGSLYELDDFGESYELQWKNLILPAVVLGIRPLAVIIQLMRNSMLEVLSQDYIRTARAKGLNQFQVVKNHAFRNSLNPEAKSWL